MQAAARCISVARVSTTDMDYIPLILVGFCFSARSIENIGKAVLFRPLCVHWLGVHALLVGRAIIIVKQTLAVLIPFTSVYCNKNGPLPL